MKRLFRCVLFSIVPMLLLCTACDDSASSKDDDIEQVAVPQTNASYDDALALFRKWNGTVPSGWTRSSRYYSADNQTGFSADVFYSYLPSNWQGKQLHLAHNFKDEDGNVMYEDIIFFFDKNRFR